MILGSICSGIEAATVAWQPVAGGGVTQQMQLWEPETEIAEEAGLVEDAEAGESDHNYSRMARIGLHRVSLELETRHYVALCAPEGLAYDLVADLGPRLAKVQVKTTRAPRADGLYHFSTRRWVRRSGPSHMKTYTEADTAMFALVALDLRRVLFVLTADVTAAMGFSAKPSAFRDGATDVSLNHCVARLGKAA
jgi:hypothetical protein